MAHGPDFGMPILESIEKEVCYLLKLETVKEPIKRYLNVKNDGVPELNDTKAYSQGGRNKIHLLGTALRQCSTIG